MSHNTSAGPARHPSLSPLRKTSPIPAARHPSLSPLQNSVAVDGSSNGGNLGNLGSTALASSPHQSHQSVANETQKQNLPPLLYESIEAAPDGTVFTALDLERYDPHYGTKNGLKISDEILWDDNLLSKIKRKKPQPCNCYEDEDGACKDSACLNFAMNYECGGCNCPAGNSCQNRKIERRQWRSVEVFRCGEKGLGLQAGEDIRKGEFIIEYVGQVVDIKIKDKLFHDYRKMSMLYILQLDNRFMIDARKRGGIARYINHSCRPNCTMEIWTVKGIKRAAIFPTRDLKKGEEMTFDYEWELYPGRPLTKCHCGEDCCRGFLEKHSEIDLKRVSPTFEEDEDEDEPGAYRFPTDEEKAYTTELVGRKVRVYFGGNYEFYEAKVSSYDDSASKHVLLYIADQEQVSERLSDSKWQIFDSQLKSNKIIKKDVAPTLLPKFSGATPTNLTSTVEIPVAPHIHDVLMFKNIQMKVQEFSGQKIRLTTEIVRKSDMEWSETHLQAIMNVDKRPLVHYFLYKLAGPNPSLEATLNFVVSQIEAISNTILSSKQTKTHKMVMIIPSSVVQPFKAKTQQMQQSRLKGATLQFKSPANKRAPFAFLSIFASDEPSLLKILQILNSEFNTLAHPNGDYPTLPRNHLLYPRHFGYLVDPVQVSDLELLKDKRIISCDYGALIADFESRFDCSIHIMEETPLNLIDNIDNSDSENKTKREVYVNSRDGTFASLDHLHIIRNELQQIIVNIQMGAKYVSIPKTFPAHDLSKLPGFGDFSFFHYVKTTTGVQISRDILSDYRFIFSPPQGPAITTPFPRKLSDMEWAENLFKAQMALIKRANRRKQRWCFGGSPRYTYQAAQLNIQNANLLNSNKLSAFTRTAAETTIAFTQLVNKLKLPQSTAYHAALLCHKFYSTKMASSPNAIEDATNIKISDVFLATLFIANKSQKSVKWRSADKILQAYYQQLHPSDSFDIDSPSIQTAINKIITSESEILTIINYQTCFPGINWIATRMEDVMRKVAKNPKKMEEYNEKITKALQVALCGPTLAAGSSLLLVHRLEAIVVGCFALVSSHIEHVEKLIIAFQLNWREVYETAKIVQGAIAFYGDKKHRDTNHREVVSTLSKIQFHWGKFNEFCQTIEIDAPLNLNVSDNEFVNKDNMIRKINDEMHDGCKCTLDVSAARSISMSSLHEMATKTSCTAVHPIDDRTLEIVGKRKNVDMMVELLRSTLKKSNNRPPQVQYKRLGGNSPKFGGDYDASTTNNLVNIGSSRKTGDLDHVLVKNKHLTRHNLDYFLPGRLGIDGVPNLQNIYPLHKESMTNPMVRKSGNRNSSTAQDDAVSLLLGDNDSNSFDVTLALHQYPPAKSRKREVEYAGYMGYSATNLNAMQILYQMHYQMNSSFGHPNFVLPIGLVTNSEDSGAAASSSTTAAPVSKPQKAEESKEETADDDFGLSFNDDDLMGRMFEDSNKKQKLDSELDFTSDFNFEDEMLGEDEEEEDDDDDDNEDDGEGEDNEEEKEEKSEGNSKKRKRGNKDEKKRRSTPGPTKKKLSASEASKREKLFLLTDQLPISLTKICKLHSKQHSKKSKDGKFELISPVVFRSIFRDILRIIQHVHANSMVLRTFELGSFVFDAAGTLKLSGVQNLSVISDDKSRVSDGLRSCSRKKKPAVYSSSNLSNTAPEMILGSRIYTQNTDLWSAACVLSALLIGKPLYSGKDEASIMKSIFKISGSISRENFPNGKKFPNYKKYQLEDKRYKEGIAKAFAGMMGAEAAEAYSGAIKLLARILTLDPMSRLSASDCLVDEYFLKGADEESRAFSTEWTKLRERSAGGKEGDVSKEEEAMWSAIRAAQNGKPQKGGQAKSSQQQQQQQQQQQSNGMADNMGLYDF